MKQRYTFLFASIVLSGSLTAQVNNGGFEAWTGQVPNVWSNNNIAPAELFPVTSSDDAHGGVLACRGEVILSGIAIPPILQNLAQPVTGTPSSFTGWYKFGPQAAGDLLSISITVVDAGGGLVAGGILQYTEAQPTYAQFSVPLTAFNTNVAATATLSFGISGAGGSPTAGSWFLIDDLELGTGTGIGEEATSVMAVGQSYSTGHHRSARSPELEQGIAHQRTGVRPPRPCASHGSRSGTGAGRACAQLVVAHGVGRWTVRAAADGWQRGDRSSVGSAAVSDHPFQASPSNR